MEFKRPKSYKPSFGQPSPSRDEILKSELGFDGGKSVVGTNANNEVPLFALVQSSITSVCRFRFFKIDVMSVFAFLCRNSINLYTLPMSVAATSYFGNNFRLFR